MKTLHHLTGWLPTMSAPWSAAFGIALNLLSAFSVGAVCIQCWCCLHSVVVLSAFSGGAVCIQCWWSMISRWLQDLSSYKRSTAHRDSASVYNWTQGMVAPVSIIVLRPRAATGVNFTGVVTPICMILMAKTSSRNFDRQFYFLNVWPHCKWLLTDWLYWKSANDCWLHAHFDPILVRKKAKRPHPLVYGVKVSSLRI